MFAPNNRHDSIMVSQRPNFSVNVSTHNTEGQNSLWLSMHLTERPSIKKRGKIMQLSADHLDARSIKCLFAPRSTTLFSAVHTNIPKPSDSSFNICISWQPKAYDKIFEVMGRNLTLSLKKPNISTVLTFGSTKNTWAGMYLGHTHVMNYVIKVPLVRIGGRVYSLFLFCSFLL